MKKFPPRTPTRFLDKEQATVFVRTSFSDPFLREGHCIARELSFRGISKPIPPGESAITSLVHQSRKVVFGATSGTRSHLFKYIGGALQEVILYLVCIGENCSVRHSLAVVGDLIIGGTDTGSLFLYDETTEFVEVKGEWSGTDAIQEWGFRRGVIRKVATPTQGEGISCLLSDPHRQIAYGISDKTGQLFSFDPTTSSSSLIGYADPAGEFSKEIILDIHGNLYAVGVAGRIVRYSPSSGKLEVLPISIPNFAGRKVYTRVTAFALDSHRNIIYGGTENGFLFRFHPDEARIYPLGKPTELDYINCLTVGRDGSLYGIAGTEHDMAHFFKYDPRYGSLKDLGIPLATLEKPCYAYRVESMTTGPDGEIYLGESDRISHLFTYFPPIEQHNL